MNDKGKKMKRKIIPVFFIFAMVLSAFGCSNSTSGREAEKKSEPSQTVTQTDESSAQNVAQAAGKSNKKYFPLTRIVLITTGKACNCTMTRCKKGEEALKTAMAKHPDAPNVERIDFALDTEKANRLVDKYKAMMLPIIFFLDDGETLLSKFEGDFDWTEIDRELSKYKVK